MNCRSILTQSFVHETINATMETGLNVSQRKQQRTRRGASVVEFAIVAPLFFLLVLGMIEFGRMVMVQQVLTNASREGARRAVLSGISDTDVETTVEDYLANASISGATVTVTTQAPTPPDTAEARIVTVTIPFSQVSWLPTPIFMGSKTLSASTTMRRETLN
jgi:Flp pilus assembly protein TadG